MSNQPTQPGSGEIAEALEPTEMEKDLAHSMGVPVSQLQAAERRAKASQLRSLGLPEEVIEAIVNEPPAKN